MIALIGNLDLTEVLVIALGAVMVFGRRLPQVLAKGVVQFQRVRRSVQQVWRETGISQEMRNLQQELNEVSPTKLNPLSDVRQSVDELKVKVTKLDQVGLDDLEPPPAPPVAEASGLETPINPKEAPGNPEREES